jgi:N-acetylglutamate synthase
LDESLEDKVARCEAWYAERKQPCTFRLTPYSEPSLDDYLAERGYEMVDRTCVLQRPTHPWDASASAVGLRSAGRDEWLHAYHWMTGKQGGASPALRCLLDSMTSDRLLAILRSEEAPARPVACGLGVIQGEFLGLYDLVTAPRHRRKGYGTELVRGLVAWGAGNGARRAYLQVARANRPARRLYEKLEFEWVYDFWYRVRESRPEAGTAALRSSRG